MKKLLELIAGILHPIAVVLIWIDLLRRSDIGLIPKLTWAVFSLIQLVPFLYVLTGPTAALRVMLEGIVIQAALDAHCRQHPQARRVSPTWPSRPPGSTAILSPAT